MNENRRPWGYFEVLFEDPFYKIKRLVVFPGKRLSLQYHRRRSEHWSIVRGEGLVTRNDQELPVRPGHALDIPQGAVHRVRNTGSEDLVIVEVQFGDYFGEDDIVRLHDDFDRACEPSAKPEKKAE